MNTTFNPEINMMDIIAIIPLMIPVIGACVLLSIDLISKTFDRKIYVRISILFLLISLLITLNNTNEVLGFYKLIEINKTTILTQSIILIASILFLILTLCKYKVVELDKPEFYALLLFATSGFQTMVSSNNLLLILLGLECASLSIYSMIALANNNKSIEAGIKYFTLGALATGFYAFGMMFIYINFGSIDLNNLYMFNNKYLALIGFIFLLGALGFKMSIFPFHNWLPEVYDGTNPPFTFYISIVPKIATFIVIVNIITIFFNLQMLNFIEIILSIIAILTMTIPNITALVQNNVKRMLAYSSIAQSGIILTCIINGFYISDGFNTLFLYWILFLFANFGVFGMLWVLSSNNYLYDNFKGIAKTNPIFAIAMAIFMLSLAGIPPFGLFFGKMFAILSSIRSNNYILAIAIVINSAIAAYYYLKLIVIMFFYEKIEIKQINITYPIIITISVSILFCIFGVFFIENIIELINYCINPNSL